MSQFKDGRAQEIRQDDLLRRVQDVAISTRIAIDHASKALGYAEVSLREAGDRAASGVGEASKEAKRRAKEITKAERKLERAIEEMRKARSGLEDSLRRRP